MEKNNVLDFKAMSNKKLREQFELEDCDEDLMDLVSKLVNCSPGSMHKKKDSSKEKLLNKIRAQRDADNTGAGTPAVAELSDDELDSAAGGIRPLSDLPQNPNKPPNGDGGNL